MRIRAKDTKDGRGRMSDFKCKGLSKEAPPSRISGVVSILASTGKGVLSASN